jgi:hypothetical protein
MIRETKETLDTMADLATNFIQSSLKKKCTQILRLMLANAEFQKRSLGERFCIAYWWDALFSELARVLWRHVIQP